MKKILFLTGSYGNRGGAISMLTLIRDLKSKGFEIELVTSVHGDAEKIQENYGVHAHYIKSYNWMIFLSKRNLISARLKDHIKKIYNMLAERKLFKFIKEYNPDIVIINSSDQYVGIKSCNRLKIPVVMYFREFMTLDHGECYWSEKMARKYFQKLNGGIAISNEIKNYFLQYPIKNLKVIYNGIDVKAYNIISQKRFKSVFKISCVGVISEGKNQLLALKAVVLLLNNGINNFHFYFYGDDTREYAKELKEFVVKNDISNYVTFVGFVNDPNQIYGGTHINLLCSKNEAFGRTIIEGMINHCLSIVSDSGGAKEIIKDKYNGLLFKNDNAEMLCRVLIYAMQNYEELSNMIQQGFNDALNKFSLEANEKNVEEYLNMICEES